MHAASCMYDRLSIDFESVSSVKICVNSVGYGAYLLENRNYKY